MQGKKIYKWAAPWQNQQNGCAPSEDSDQPGHPPSPIRVFPVCMKKAWVISYPLSAQRRLWSDWADAQTDPSLRWVHTHFVGFVMSWLKFCVSFIPKTLPDEAVTCMNICQPWNRVNTADDCLQQLSHVMRKPAYTICKQQRRTSACASTQCDHYVWCSLSG